MEFSILNFNWLGIVIATIAYSFVSGMWHRSFAFGKKWERAMGFERPDNWSETNLYYIVPFIGCFLASFAIGVMHTWMDIDTLKPAILLGLTVGIGIGTTVTFTNAVIPIMKQPLVFGFITGTAHAIGLTLASTLIFLI